MSHLHLKTTRDYIRDLGRFLARNNSYWQRASVIGHTDRRGSRSMNQELSEARARTVYNALSNAGVDSSKMGFEGRAFDEPVPGAPDNAQGWKLNRRVELTFFGVAAPQKLIDEINDLNRRYGFGSQRYQNQ